MSLSRPMPFSRSVLCTLCLLSVGGLGLLAPRPAAAELIGIASNFAFNNPGAIYSINQGTGSATLLTTTPGTQPVFTGAEFRQGVLYATDINVGGAPMFGTYDLSTGAFTQISNLGSFALYSLAYRPNNDLFYSVDMAGNRPLVTINPITGAVTTIGNTTTDVIGLAFDQGNDILYGVNSNIDLLRINLSSGAVTTIRGDGAECRVSGRSRLR